MVLVAAREAKSSESISKTDTSPPKMGAVAEAGFKPLHSLTMEISQQDRLRYGEPDPDFNEAHNKSVIAETIKTTDKIHELKNKEFEDGLSERSDAIYSFIRHISKGGNGDKSIEKYLGNEYYMKLLGEQRLNDLKRRMNIPNLSK